MVNVLQSTYGEVIVNYAIGSHMFFFGFGLWPLLALPAASNPFNFVWYDEVKLEKFNLKHSLSYGKCII
jgi:hypothetical protein